jgi:hypothetical protein
MSNIIDNQVKTTTNEELIIKTALKQAGYYPEEIDMKIDTLKSRDNLPLRDSIIKEISAVMKSQTCGFASSYVYRLISIVTNLSWGTVSLKAQSNKIPQYSTKNIK